MYFLNCRKKKKVLNWTYFSIRIVRKKFQDQHGNALGEACVFSLLEKMHKHYKWWKRNLNFRIALFSGMFWRISFKNCLLCFIPLNRRSQYKEDSYRKPRRNCMQSDANSEENGCEVCSSLQWSRQEFHACSNGEVY